MNSPEAQYQLAKKMPTASLANILRGIPGAIDQGIAMMVLGERQRMKTASQGQQAGAEAQQPSVKDRMLLAQQGQLPEHQGIGTLPSPNMGQVADVAMGAQGGVVGFAGGGDVAKFAGPMGSVVGAPYNPQVLLDPQFYYSPEFEALTNEEKMRYLQQREIAARQAAGKIGGANDSAPRATPKNLPPVELAPRVAPTATTAPIAPAGGVASTPAAQSWAAKNIPTFARAGASVLKKVPVVGKVALAGEAGLEVGSNIYDAFATNIQDKLASDATKKREAQGTAPVDYNSFPSQQLSGPTTDIAAAPVSTGRPRGEAAPSGGKGIDDLKLLPAQPALPMTDYSTSPDVPASPSAAAKPDTADSAEDIKALAPVSSFAATQGIMNASTQPYMDELTKLAKGINLNEGEKESQKYTRLGNTFLSAAQELLTSSRPGASSVGAALGKVGTLAQKYAEEDTVERKAAIGSKISLLGAQVQVAQGNTKSAIDMFNHAEQMAFKGIELRTNTKIRNEELRLKELGIFNEKDFRNRQIEYHNADILERREWHKANLPLLAAHAKYWNAAGATAGNKGSITAAKFADITRDVTKEVDTLFKNPVATAKLRTAYPGMQDEDIRQQLINTGIRSATSGLAGLDAQRGSGLVDMPEDGKMKSGKALGE